MQNIGIERRPPGWGSIALACSVAVIVAALPAAATAQAYQCRAPGNLPAARAATSQSPAIRTPTTAYTLALSWSPEFCRSRARDPAHRLQCSGPNAGGAGRFGFIVHGLWPEGARAAPQWCRQVPPPAASVVRGQLCRTPSVDLIGHEWAKHGSCMARDAGGYFKVGNILYDAMRFPAMEALSRDPALTAGALRQALADSNPGRPANSFGLLTSRTGWLREVRVCLNRRFRPARCAARQYGPRDAAALKIWRGL